MRRVPILVRSVLVLAMLAHVGCKSTQSPAEESVTNTDDAREDSPTFAARESPAVGAQADLLVAELTPKSGSQVSGRLVFTPSPGNPGEVGGGSGLQITGQISGLTPNASHGVHIHEFGVCDPEDASLAGEHFNPTGSPHGPLRTQFHDTHAGDLGNVTADANGTAQVNLTAPALALLEGNFAVMGRALVVHQGADDLDSQPSGNSGTRIACGVIDLPGQNEK